MCLVDCCTDLRPYCIQALDFLCRSSNRLAKMLQIPARLDDLFLLLYELGALCTIVSTC